MPTTVKLSGLRALRLLGRRSALKHSPSPPEAPRSFMEVSGSGEDSPTRSSERIGVGHDSVTPWG